MIIVKNEVTGNTFKMSASKVAKLCKKWIERLIGFDCYVNGWAEEPLSLRECLDLAINEDERFIDFLDFEEIYFTEKDEFILKFIKANEKEFELNLDLHFKYVEK